MLRVEDPKLLCLSFNLQLWLQVMFATVDLTPTCAFGSHLFDMPGNEARSWRTGVLRYNDHISI